MKISHIGLAVLAMAAWGFNFVAISLGLKELPPFLFTALRFLLTAFPLLLFVRRPNIDWKVLVAVGVFLLTLQFAFLFKGMALGVGGGIASTVIQCQVFFSIIGGAIILNEKPTLRDLCGLIIAAMGIFLIALTMGRATLNGLMLVVLAGLSWAIGNIFLKRAGKVDMLSLIAYASLIPPLPLLLLSYFFEGPERWFYAFNHITLLSGFSLLYIVLISTLFSYGVWGFLMRNYAVNRVAPFGLLVPVFGVFSGWLVMNESFGPQRLAGAGLVIIGLVAVNWRQFTGLLKKKREANFAMGNAQIRSDNKC